MSNPKRKVTDLLPSEAILIRSDADLKVLEEFEKEGVMWIGGIEKPTEWNPSRLFSYPFYIFYENDRISWTVRGINPYPATDFIPNDPERGLTILKGDGSIISAQNQDGRVFDIEPITTEADEVDKFDLSKLTRYDLQVFGAGNAQMRKNSHGDYVLWSDIEQLLKTRNTPNQ